MYKIDVVAKSNYAIKFDQKSVYSAFVRGHCFVFCLLMTFLLLMSLNII